MRKRQAKAIAALDREKECLELLRSLRHDNIVELLATYTHRQQHNLLFPLLPMDLEEFLNRQTRFESFQNNLTFYSALYGLASAIDAVHNLNIKAQQYQEAFTMIGYHHDIRPKNILVTPSTFLLADFGLARFKSADQSSKTPWKSGFGDQIAPECMDEDGRSLKVGRSMDIWSFGCLIANIATYMEQGPSGVKEFREKRESYDTDGQWKQFYFFQGKQVKQSVPDWLGLLDTNAQDRSIRCLTEMTRLMLKIQDSERPNARETCRHFCWIFCKTTFRAVLELVKDFSCGQTEFKGNPWWYTQMEIQFYFAMLRAWGSVLGMDKDRMGSSLMKLESSVEHSIKASLCQLYQDMQAAAARTSIKEQTTPHDATDGQRTIALSHYAMNDVLRRSVHDLLFHVPPVYQTRIAQEYRREVLHETDENKLENIESCTQNLRAPYSDVGVFAALKRLEIALSKETESMGPEQNQLILKPWHVTDTTVVDAIHEIGSYRSVERSTGSGIPNQIHRRKVIVEYMLYSPAWNAQSEEEKVLKVIAFTELLHSPKPTSFHVLDCIGVIPPTPRSAHDGFGFVYALPDRLQECSNPRSRTLLQTMQQHKDQTPLLEDKFKIARCLASSIFELHSAGWLHKNLSSSSIVFFDHHIRNDPTSFKAEPYLLEFNYSRPDGEIWFSSVDVRIRTPYQHPAYDPDKNRFEKIYDYYSVGVILLEIGFWEPISTFESRHKNQTEEDFQNLLVQRYAPKLGPKMGSLYRDVVVACLSGTFQDTTEEPEICDIAVHFYWAVVARLSSCRLTD